MTLIERRAIHKKLKKAKEPILELLGSKDTSTLYFLPSFEQVLLKTLYEVVMPIAQRTGRNEILLPQGAQKEIYEVVKAAGRLGLSIKEVEVDSSGRVSEETLRKACSKRSVAFFTSWIEMYTGAIHPIAKLSKVCNDNELFFFVDATDVVGKVYFRLQNLAIDLLTVCHTQGTMVYASKPLKGAPWGEDFSIEAYLNFSSYAQELVEKMDVQAMECMQRKRMVEEKYKDILFLNQGAGYLYDRWCFAVPGIISENLAYHLLSAGIEVDYLGVGAHLEARGIAKEQALCAVSMRFNIIESNQECLDRWDTILKVSEKILRYSYV